MTDIYDLAKPVRDVTLKEIERVMAHDRLPDAVADGHRLGVHLVAVAIANTSERDGLSAKVSADYDIHAVYAVAIGMLIGYAGSSFRPFLNGTPVPPTASGHLLMQRIGPCAMEQLASAENGTLDFNTSFKRTESGRIEAEEFDYSKMLKGKP